MTVAELIEKLSAVPDKSIEVKFDTEGAAFYSHFVNVDACSYDEPMGVVSLCSDNSRVHEWLVDKYHPLPNIGQAEWLEAQLKAADDALLADETITTYEQYKAARDAYRALRGKR